MSTAARHTPRIRIIWSLRSPMVLGRGTGPILRKWLSFDMKPIDGKLGSQAASPRLRTGTYKPRRSYLRRAWDPRLLYFSTRHCNDCNYILGLRYSLATSGPAKSLRQFCCAIFRGRQIRIWAPTRLPHLARITFRTGHHMEFPSIFKENQGFLQYCVPSQDGGQGNLGHQASSPQDLFQQLPSPDFGCLPMRMSLLFCSFHLPRLFVRVSTRKVGLGLGSTWYSPGDWIADFRD